LETPLETSLDLQVFIITANLKTLQEKQQSDFFVFDATPTGLTLNPKDIYQMGFRSPNILIPLPTS
jgi:hypothetical protein